MTSPLEVLKLSANLKVTMYDHDPDSTAATVVEWVAARDMKNFLGMAMTSALTGAGFTLMEIVAATSSTGENAAQIVTSGTVAPDAVGDYVQLELTQEQLAQEGSDAGVSYTHYGVRLTMDNAADEAVVAYIEESKRPHRALTANYIST